jgi:GWxTD domain-containing protein
MTHRRAAFRLRRPETPSPPRAGPRRRRALAGLLAASLVLPCVLRLPSATRTCAQERVPAEPAKRIVLLSTEMRYQLRGLQSILTPAELDELLARRNDLYMQRWIDEYWKLKDPVYTTAENEALEEYNRRVAFAESAFAIRTWPMWDQRGEIYVRYGHPAAREIIPPEVYASGTSPPGELWYYPQFDLFVLFEDARSSGEYTYYLERVKGPPGIRMNKITDQIDELSANLGSIPPPSISYESETDAFRKMFNKLENVIEATPAAFRFDFARNRMPFVFSIDRFRGDRDVARIDVNIEFRADVSPSAAGDRMSEYVATAVVWNTGHAEVARKEQRLSVPLAAAADSTRLVPAQIVFSLPPGFYFAAVTLEERRSGRTGSFERNVTCEDFEHKLAVSDILFASAIEPASQTSPFNRGPLLVVPHPLCRYRIPASIPVYFEVYNLTVDGRGISSYDVEYRIVSQTPRKIGFWDTIRGKKRSLDVSSRFHTAHPGSSDQVHITLGTDNLWPGAFELTVRIIDALAQTETVRRRTFEVLE